jgi:ceramide glucosyltransferase
MSGFVNANALLGYVPLTFFTEPYTVTGHIFALRRTIFEQTGGMAGMDGRFDDDHEIARRVRAVGLSCLQTPLIYQVKNVLPTLDAYHTQMRRWFVMPRQAMVPHLTPKERLLSLLLSIGNFLPSALLVLALCYPGTVTFACVLCAFSAFLVTYCHLESKYLPVRIPTNRILLLPIVAFIVPLHVLAALILPGDRIEWRGQTYRAHRGGALEILEEEK